MEYLNNLNEKQREAVLHNDGPCLVLAGAGSGKTKVLTTRIANLINNDIESYNILAITFTNKAAREMRLRLDVISPDNYAFVGTFHSLGLRIIRENCEALDLTRNFTIIDSDDCLSVIKKIMKDNGYDPKFTSPSYVRSRISFIKNEMLSEGEISKFFNTPPEKIAEQVYYQYRKILKKNNSVDFDDLLTLPVELFMKDREILGRYQDKYKYILVDEYQDTNEVQYKLTKLLAGKYKNIFCVGDPDQSIYSFRGANFKNILNFENDYKNAKIIPLEENYRSTENILKAANSVIKNNKERKEKNLYSNLGEGIKIQYIRSYDEKHEVTLILEEIKKLYNTGYEYKDISILYRTNGQARVVEEKLLGANIPYKVVGSYYFYGRKEIKDLLSYLRLILNQNDDISLRRVINVPKRKIGAATVANIEIKATEQNISMFESIDSGKELEFKEIMNIIISKSENLSLTELIDLVLDESGMRSELEKEKTLESEIRLENLNEFKSITASFEERTGSVNLADFLEEVSLIADMSEHKATNEGVTLMTIHSAKGLEFEIVFLIGMEEGIFPHSAAFLEDGGIEEERRLAYVGITRAKKRLFLLNSKRRMLYGKDTQNPPSRFIKEIDKDVLDIVNSQLEEKEKINKGDFYSDKGDVDFKNGDVIMHTLYGRGVIIETGELLSIAFAKNYGIKKIKKNYKGLRKV